MKKHLFFLLFFSSLFSLTTHAQNLISNGSFENDFANWNNLVGGTASATFSVETTDVQDGGKAMKVVVATPGANAYDVQSINSAWASESGKEYTLSFYAKANEAGKTLRVVQQTNTYSQKEFVLTTAWQKYEWTFTAQEAGLQLRLNFPVAGTFLIDNVNIPGVTPAQTPNFIPNGSFEMDFASWTNLAGGGSAATFSIETNDKTDGAKAMKVVVTTAGANAYDVQSINSAWPSETGKQYTLSFYAKASEAGKTLRVVQQKNTYSQREFTLTTAWQKYEWSFTAQEDNLQLRFNFPVAGTFLIDNVYIPGSADVIPPPYTPTGPPIATGNPKFLGSVYSPAQKVNFTAYFNQVTPENDGKWGVVEGTRDVMNWSGLDSAYKLARDNGFPFKMHALVWGNQQPGWIETLPPAEQLEEIEEWYAAVAARYPDIDFIEVVNEPINDPPSSAGNGGGNYINALGGTGSTGWDWVIKSFKLARQYFPAKTKLMINEYNIVSSASRTNQYKDLVNLLKAENLIDAIGVQAHAFSTTAPSATITNSLDVLATTGLPLYATELDIDGLQNTTQLNAYKRIFPLFWEHPAVKGVTLWGYRPGHWRTNEGAYIVYANGAERPAMEWLKEYIRGTTLPVALHSFEARKANNKVWLTWKTTSEINNDYFMVERSNDGTNYEPLAKVEGDITSEAIKEYTAYDEKPNSGLNYYRLAQVDVDGNKKYHGVRVVDFGDKNAAFVQVYPNPATTSFTIRTAPNIKRATVTITDASGRTIKNIVMPGTGIHTVSAAGLTNGTYYIRLYSSGETKTTKVLINNK